MPQLRIALAQVNATVGDLAGNAGKALEWTMRAAEQGARIVVFPEMMLTGYPVEDLALRRSFVDASISALEELSTALTREGLDGVAVVIGYLDRRADQQPRVGVPAGSPLDAAAVLHGGNVAITSAKHHLPNYGVFDEFRYFVPGDTLPVFRMQAQGGEPVDIAVAICEDLWQDGGPVAVCHTSGASLLVVPNASPYERNKDDVRLELCQRRAAEAGAVLAYGNLVGGQDELVFDGDSLIVSPAGELLARGPQFEEALVIADLDLPAADLSRAPGRSRTDAGDGTTMTIERIELASLAAPQPAVPSSTGPRR
jgi:NAD+ synthase (glutamine-hydrolysing)